MSDCLKDYLTAIGRTPMLSADEQIMLGTAVRRWLDAPEPSVAVIRRGRRAKERMVTANLRLVVAWAKRFRNKGVPMEDLVQEGNTGLIRAVEKYDPTTGYRFATYAVWWIRQALSKAVQNQSSTIRRPSSAQTTRNKAAAFSEAFRKEYGRVPVLAEVAEGLGVKEASLRTTLDCITAAEKTLSLDAKLSGGDGESSFIDVVAAPGEDPFEEMDRQLAWEQVEAALAHLPQHEQQLLLEPSSGRNTAHQRAAKKSALHRLTLYVSGEKVEERSAPPIKALPAAHLAKQLKELDLLAA